jgi:hypothetical protein
MEAIREKYDLRGQEQAQVVFDRLRYILRVRNSRYFSRFKIINVTNSFKLAGISKRFSV